VAQQAVTDTGPAGAGLLYDSRRGVYYAKPVLRGWLHLLCFWAAVAGGALLLTRAHGAAQTAASAVYAASLAGLLGTSALYHRGTWSAVAQRRLRHLDQAMIFFLIAGTATPAYLLAAPGDAGLAGLTVTWVLTLAVAAVRTVRPDMPERVAGVLFIGLGCAGCLAMPWAWLHNGPGTGGLLLAGSLLYAVGALLYHRRWPDPYPSVFGYHEVFHVCVCAAAACQYLAIAQLVG
jgi:hemolysin III